MLLRIYHIYKSRMRKKTQIPTSHPSDSDSLIRSQVMLKLLVRGPHIGWFWYRILKHSAMNKIKIMIKGVLRKRSGKGQIAILYSRYH